MFSFDDEDVENGSTVCVYTGVMGVTGASSPASEDEHEMDPPEGDEVIHDPRLADHEPEGARPGLDMAAEIGVVGASGW